MNIFDNRLAAPDPQEAFTLRLTVGPEDAGTACDLIAARAGLAKSRVKDAMCKGAVWLTGKRGGRKRLRKATAQPGPGEPTLAEVRWVRPLPFTDNGPTSSG